MTVLSRDAVSYGLKKRESARSRTCSILAKAKAAPTGAHSTPNPESRAGRGWPQRSHSSRSARYLPEKVPTPLSSDTIKASSPFPEAEVPRHLGHHTQGQQIQGPPSCFHSWRCLSGGGLPGFRLIYLILLKAKQGCRSGEFRSRLYAEAAGAKALVI